MQWLYLVVLTVSLAGLGYIDYRYKLAIFWRPKRIALVLLCGVGFFLAWDITGIALGIFSTKPEFVSGLHVVTPNLPIEEFGFLTLLIYQTIILWRFSCSRTS